MIPFLSSKVNAITCIIVMLENNDNCDLDLLVFESMNVLVSDKQI